MKLPRPVDHTELTRSEDVLRVEDTKSTVKHECVTSRKTSLIEDETAWKSLLPNAGYVGV
jgi:hypothetical protein